MVCASLHGTPAMAFREMSAFLLDLHRYLETKSFERERDNTVGCVHVKVYSCNRIFFLKLAISLRR